MSTAELQHTCRELQHVYITMRGSAHSQTETFILMSVRVRKACICCAHGDVASQTSRGTKRLNLKTLHI